MAWSAILHHILIWSLLVGINSKMDSFYLNELSRNVAAGNVVKDTLLVLRNTMLT